MKKSVQLDTKISFLYFIYFMLLDLRVNMNLMQNY